MDRLDAKDFKRRSWHDDTLYGLRPEIGDPERNAFNWPRGAFLSFGASGFTQTPRAQPVLRGEQRLSGAEWG